MMFELISLSAEIGSIEHDGYIQKKIDSIMKKRNYKKICKRIDNLKYGNILEFIKEFMKIMGSVYAMDCGNEVMNSFIDVYGYYVDFRFKYYNHNKTDISIDWIDTGESDIHKIDIEDIQPISIIHVSKSASPWNKDIDMIHEDVLYKCMKEELKYICKSLIYKEDLKNVH